MLSRCSIHHLAILTLMQASLATASDWPQWRGPNRDDVSAETGLLNQWPPGGPPLAWKTTALGSGFSSVAVANGRIYTMGDLPDACHVFALEEKTGKQLWKAPLGLPVGHNKYPGPRATPTIDGDALYTLTQHGDLVCLETATGKERWHKNLEKDFGGRMMSGWRYSESVLVDGGQVVCTPGGSGGTVLALNKKTGDVIWRSKEFTDPAAYSSLVPVEIGGVRQYLQFTGASVAGVAAKDGKLLWRADRPGKTAVIPTPIYHDQQVFVTSGYGIGCNLFKVSAAGGKFSVAEVYANQDMKNHHGGVIRLGDHVYGVNDPRSLTCMEFKTGKVLWTDPSVGKGAVAYADGHLYVRSESGKGSVALVEATPKGYAEKGRFDQPDRSDRQSWPHPVIANGRLYLRDQDVLLCYDVKAK